MPPNTRDHILPEGATKLVVDWYYSARDFPEDTEMCQKCDGSGCEECTQGLKMDGTEAEIYEGTGDVRCPHCELIHMTPANSHVQAGVLNCQKCGEVSVVTDEIAEKCREISSSY